jgi:hypothetical protein
LQHVQLTAVRPRLARHTQFPGQVIPALALAGQGVDDEVRLAPHKRAVHHQAVHHVLHGVVEACERERLHHNDFRRHELRCAPEHLRELRFVALEPHAHVRYVVHQREARRDRLKVHA